MTTALAGGRFWEVTGAVAIAATMLAGCTETGATKPPSPTQAAEQLVQVTTPHADTGLTLLEGPVVDAAGMLYFVDVTAPPGAPKVLRLDPTTQEHTAVYTDDRSVLTSAQFGPLDGRLYVTDFLGGRVLSMTAEGDDVQLVFEGDVEGVAMQPDDLSFGPDDALFLTDASGARAPHWEPSGRLIRLDADGSDPVVLADELASPNGIAFTPDFDALWVTMNTGNTVDHITLSEDSREVATSHPALHLNLGTGQVDSAAVDADGNLYLCHHNRGEIVVYSPEGEKLMTIETHLEGAGPISATNIAIVPGTTTGYATVSNESGGFIFTFDALGEGIRQSNGG